MELKISSDALKSGAFFIMIMRAKSNMKYEIVSSYFNFDSSTGIVGDHIIRLSMN